MTKQKTKRKLRAIEKPLINSISSSPSAPGWVQLGQFSTQTHLCVWLQHSSLCDWEASHFHDNRKGYETFPEQIEFEFSLIWKRHTDLTGAAGETHQQVPGAKDVEKRSTWRALWVILSIIITQDSSIHSFIQSLLTGLLWRFRLYMRCPVSVQNNHKDLK